jgi:hypothetical protein
LFGGKNFLETTPAAARRLHRVGELSLAGGVIKIGAALFFQVVDV